MTPMLRREANDVFRRTLTRTVVIPLVLLAVLAGIFAFLISNLLTAAAWVEHTDQVIADANQLQTTIIDQETGVRGFLLTNDQVFLEPYTAAIGEIEQQFTELANLVSDNPPQVARINSVRALNQTWQAYALDVLARKQANGNYADTVAAGSGKRIVDQMRAAIGAFIGTEEQLRAGRTATAQRTTVGVLGGSVVTALLLGGLLTMTTRRSLLGIAHTYDTALSISETNERELFTQREWFQSTLSGIGDAVIATDARGSISFMNAVAETLTGWTRDQALGKPLTNVFQIINEYTHEPAEVPVERVLREGVVIGLANHTLLVRPDGTSLPIDDSAAPVRDPNGAMVGAVLVFRDISERSANERQLRTSEQRYRSLAEAVPVAIFTAQADGTIDYYNNRWLNYTGVSFEQAVSDGWQPYIHPADAPLVTERWSQSLTSGQPLEIEFRFRRADGAYHWHLARIEAVRDPSGTMQWIGSSVDIEDQRRFAGQIAASEQRYRDLAEAMPVLVWTAEPNGNIDYFNNYWFNYTGINANDSLRWDWAPAVHPDDLAGITERWTHSLRTGEQFMYEFRLKRTDGSFGWHLSQATLQRNDNGTAIKWYGSAVDLDDKRRAEDELRESEAAFRQITESMPQLVWTTRADGSYVYFNQRWYDFTGTTADRMVRGEGWIGLLHPDDYEQTRVAWAHSLQTGEPYSVEYRFREASTGNYHWFLGRAAAIRDSAGQIVQWFGTCTDIDDQKRVEAELRNRGEALARATNALEERNRELDQFAYVTSHDLKAPLRGIANLSQWIEEDLAGNVTDEIRNQFELLRGRVHRMEGLIDGILQYSRIGRVKSTIDTVDLNQLLDDIVDLLAPQPPIEVQIAPNLPTLQTERIHLQQVFQNLIGNALKHGQRPDLRIEVGYQDRGTFYEFSIRDNGPGIAAQYHDKIFVIFQTLASRDKVEGTGLGLSLVKKIIELHGGQIRVTSAEGAGATFYFTWPKQESGER